jgi:hypothetical protein
MSRVAVFTPTRHPGISVTAHSVLRQSVPVDYWLIADQLDRDPLIRGMMPTPKAFGPEIITTHLPIKEGNKGNLAACCNWALDIAHDLQVDAMIFLQDFIWAPEYGVARFLEAMDDHPFALHTGVSHMSPGFKALTNPPNPDWSIFPVGVDAQMPPEPWEPEPRVKWNFPHGRISNHAWEVNYGALPYALINSGVRFDEDYDKGTQWENTQFAFDIQRHFNGDRFDKSSKGYVWWDSGNVSCGLPHREYFPKTHEGERDYDNGEMFWRKNPDLVGVR